MIESPESRCRKNIECWFASTNGPLPLFLTEGDRMALCILTPVLTGWRAIIQCTIDVETHLKKYSRGTWTFGTKLKDHQVCGYPTSSDGGRECGQIRYALQWIKHCIRERVVVEIDFDGWNPGEGLGPGIFHLFGEVIPNKIFRMSTNPFVVAKYRRWLKPAEEKVNAAV